MSFLRRVVGSKSMGRAGASSEPAATSSTAPDPRLAATDWTGGARIGHPNDIRPAQMPTGGDPARWLFEVPEGVAVLSRYGEYARLNSTDEMELASALGRAKSKRGVPGRAAFGRRAHCRLSRRPPDWTAPGERGRQVWHDCRRPRESRLASPDLVGCPFLPAESSAPGASRSGSALVAEIRLPNPGNRTYFADAFDASHAFPDKQVKAAPPAAAAQAVLAVQAANAGPPRERVTVRVATRSVLGRSLPLASIRRRLPRELPSAIPRAERHLASPARGA